MQYTKIFIIFTLLFSCNLNSETEKETDITKNELHNNIEFITTEYNFPEIKYPTGFYTDTISIFDTLTNAYYTALCINSDKPEMATFNKIIHKSVITQINTEKSFINADFELTNDKSAFTYKFAPIEFYLNKDIISITHIIDTYTEGGNHHNYSWYTFNYNIKRNRIITFKNVFRLNSTEDSASFVAFVMRHKYKNECLELILPFDSIDFSFCKKGIYINPDLAWSCISARSLLPIDSLANFTEVDFM